MKKNHKSTFNVSLGTMNEYLTGYINSLLKRKKINFNLADVEILVRSVVVDSDDDVILGRSGEGVVEGEDFEDVRLAGRGGFLVDHGRGRSAVVGRPLAEGGNVQETWLPACEEWRLWQGKYSRAQWLLSRTMSAPKSCEIDFLMFHCNVK